MLRLAIVLVLSVLAQQTYADEPEAIVGGSPALPGEFRYQCSLQSRGSHFCGGSIIASTVILTAAHCVEGLNKNDFEVVTGTIDNRAGNTHRVKSFHVHIRYRGEEKFSWLHDVAVIILEAPIQYDRFQYPIPLASSPPQAGTQCILSGWGKTRTTEGFSQFLMKMPTKLITRSTCQGSHNLSIYPSNLCAFTRRGVGACQGDGGGPLICGSRQYGILSFGQPCALGVPEVYASVYYHLPFIHNFIPKN